MLAAAINAQQQQFRSGLPTQYMKGVSGQQIGDQTGRSQQLKSPGSQEVLSSVFNSGKNLHATDRPSTARITYSCVLL